MERRSGSVKSVQRNMQFNLIGKLIVKLVELEIPNVTVAHSFPGFRPDFGSYATGSNNSLHHQQQQETRNNGLVGVQILVLPQLLRQSNLDQAIMQTDPASAPAVSMNLQQGMNGMDNCLTRDFLGIEHEGNCQFLPQEMVKFASMSSSAMGLSITVAVTSNVFFLTKVFKI
ncbi:hypothetical protein HAX54_031426 [Datura stramonium]|uniref:Uncharacterized protein n=1 Tax=Datura stramonium TaxID=4076 RepID=A0ABS8VCT2_DATST|nr:hypothetical protein [Datura stramonium]